MPSTLNTGPSLPWSAMRRDAHAKEAILSIPFAFAILFVGRIATAAHVCEEEMDCVRCVSLPFISVHFFCTLRFFIASAAYPKKN